MPVYGVPYVMAVELLYILLDVEYYMIKLHTSGTYLQSN